MDVGVTRFKAVSEGIAVSGLTSRSKLSGDGISVAPG
jgi:hypothetical protein